MTDFGPVIPLDGKRPDWLTDDYQVIAFEDDAGGWYGLGLGVWYARELDDERPRALRLPADHPYYLATEKGFTYWPGGETPPADVGDGILFRNGEEAPGPGTYCYWTHDNAPGDIIGYRPEAVDEYGPPIVVNGVIPDWLRDTDVGLFENSADRRYGQDGQTLMSWMWNSDGPCPIRIRLPHDHPYYVATDKGFTYWPGGDTAPADWDGKDVLLRDGHTCPGKSVTHWGTIGFASDAEIIGYRRVDTVQVDEEHARQRFRRINNPPGHAGTAEDQHINVLKELGLIKPEPTRLERFLASTDDPTIEAALEFER